MRRLLEWMAITATLALSSVAFAQSDATASSSPPIKQTLSFVTKKPWEAARWYVVGKWVSPTRIAWVGGESLEIKYPDPKCVSTKDDVPQIVRSGEIAPSLASAEILASQDWVAIEISPTVPEEKFEVLSPRVNSNPECKSELDITYAWSAGKPGEIKPLLLLAATNNRFYGYQIDLVAPRDAEAPADIQLELLMGYWKGSFPNASAGAKPSLLFAPVGIARGEWNLPFHRPLGLTVSLEQTVASFGGAASQASLFSDWGVGVFYNFVFPWADAVLIRPRILYSQHLADDRSNLPTLAQANKMSSYIQFGGLFQIYFAGHWMVGLDASYAPSLHLAGRGLKQGFVRGVMRLGFRVNPSVSFLFEGGARSYSAEGFASERVIESQLGIRLEL